MTLTVYTFKNTSCITSLLYLKGKYCPTTCGVADYMLRYMPAVDNDLENMLDELESIANLTKEAEETVVYMKDSAAAAQKSSPGGNNFSVT